MAHPFKTGRVLKEYDSLTYRQIAEENRAVPDLQPIVVIEDRVLRGEELDQIPKNDSEFTIKYMPAGENATETGGKVTVWGIIAFTLGVVLTLFAPALGVGLMSIGGAMVLSGGAIVAAASMMQRGFGEVDDQLPQIHGARNTARQWGSVPVVLGTRLVTPYYAAKPFTSLVGNDQYLTLLFAPGYLPLTISDMKIGDTPIASFSDVTTEVIQDGSVPTLYPKTVFEESLSVLLKYDTPMVRRTQRNVSEISVDIAFVQGLCEYDDSGDKGNRTVNIEAYYKKDTDPDTSYALMGYFGSGTNDITGSTTAQVRKTVTKDVSAAGYSGAWDIKVIRNTADATDTSIVDKCYWTAYRSVRDTPPVSAAARAKIVMIGLKIRATDQLSGVVDTFNVLAKGKYLKYDGGGSGPIYWSVGETRNPAAAFLYALQGPWNPKPVPDSLIDWATLEAWYDWCQTTNVHYCDDVIDGSFLLEEALRQIALTGRATFTMRDGLYSVVHDVARTTVVQLFTPRNSKNFIGEKLFQDLPHGLRIQFINDQIGYQQDERIVYDDGYSEANATRFEKVTLSGVTDPDQIWKMGRYLLACKKLRPEMYSLTTDLEHLVCTRGDLVRVMHDVPLLGIKPARIKSLNMSGSDVASIVVDEICTMEEGKSYAVRYRRTDGLVVYKTITTVVGDQTTLTFTTAVPPAEAPAVEDLLAFGEAGLETRDMLVLNIEMSKDLGAKLYLVDYSPDVFTADSGEIPDWDPGITIPNDVQTLNTTYTPITHEELPPDVQDPGHPPSSPTFGDIQGGYDAGGGTTTPTTPTIDICKAVGTKGILITWDRQLNLTNFDRYEIQVSDDNSTWYSLQFDGTDWKGTLGADTDHDVEFLVHGGIPHTGAADNPSGRTLYYRVRRVTKEPTNSSWSTSANTTTKTVEAGDHAANSIYANNVLAAAVQTMLLRAAAMWVGYAGTGSYDSPDEGDRRIFEDEDEILFQIYTKGAWSTERQIALGGVDGNGNFRPFLGCRGLLHDIGDAPTLDPIPSRSHHLFKWNNNAQDQHGNNPWTITLGAFVYSSSVKWEGTHSLAPSDTLLNAHYAANWNYGDSVTGCFVFRHDGQQSAHGLLEWGTGNDRITLQFTYTNYMLLEISKGGTVTQQYSAALSANVWHFIGCTYDADTNTAYLRVDNTQYSFSPIGSWGAGTGNVYLSLAGGASHQRWIDDLLFSHDTAMDPDLFFQHVNRGVAWTALYFAADLLLKPKPGGRVVIDDSDTEPSGGDWHPVEDPSTGWLATKTSGWTADSFSGGLEVDFSDVGPDGKKAVRLVLISTAGSGYVYYRKSGDSNIANTPHAAGEASHRVYYHASAVYPVSEQVVVWLSSDGKAQFAVQLDTIDLYISYPAEYLI